MKIEEDDDADSDRRKDHNISLKHLQGWTLVSATKNNILKGDSLDFQHFLEQSYLSRKEKHNKEMETFLIYTFIH